MQQTFSEPTWLPDPIERACRVIPEIGIKPLVQPCFRFLVRRVNYRAPAQHFRCSVRWLMDKLGKSKATVDRYLAWLIAEGWITREQTRIVQADGSYPQAWTGLTQKALVALGLAPVCDSDPPPSPKPCPSDTANPPSGARKKFLKRAGHLLARVPRSLDSLAARIGAPRCCWLMKLCKAQGCRLQDFSQAWMALDPVSYVLAHLRRLERAVGLVVAPRWCPENQRPNAGAYVVWSNQAPAPAEQASAGAIASARGLRERWGLAPVVTG